jgi:hypothetical protein
MAMMLWDDMTWDQRWAWEYANRPYNTKSARAIRCKYTSKTPDNQLTKGYVRHIKKLDRESPGWYWHRSSVQAMQRAAHKLQRLEAKREVQAQLAEMAQDQLELDAAQARLDEEDQPFMTDAFGFCHEENYYEEPWEDCEFEDFFNEEDFEDQEDEGWGDFLTEEPEELPAARYTVIGIDMASGPDVTVFRNPCAEVALPGVDLCQFVYTPEIRWVYKHEGD